MGPADLLQHVRGAGFTLGVADGKLLVAPASMLTDDLRASLRACKPELIDLLTHAAPADPSRSLTADMIDTINAACDERGDDTGNRLALIEECLSLPTAMQADILDHFAQVARIWQRANGTRGTLKPYPNE